MTSKWMYNNIPTLRQLITEMQYFHQQNVFFKSCIYLKRSICDRRQLTSVNKNKVKFNMVRTPAIKMNYVLMLLVF